MSVTILVLNSGSSSIKFELFDMPQQKRLARGLMERIGEQQTSLSYTIGTQPKQTLAEPIADHEVGLQRIIDVLRHAWAGADDNPMARIGAVGHRLVHGGEAFSKTVVIDDDVIKAVEKHIDLAPLHNPANLLGVKVARTLMPGVVQVAVFDTAFHQTMPAHAFTYAVPHELYTSLGVRRYGFHGTSHRYVTLRAAAMLGKDASRVNLVTAHLGNGASMAAIRGGKSVDTSMGLTPLEGLVMGTRCGDIDPAVMAFLAQARGMSVSEIDTLLNKKSGVLGISGVSNDMRAIEEAARQGHALAGLALDVFCYRIKKYIGAYTAVLGDVDALVFTAGIGENSDVVRERVTEGLRPLGYDLDKDKNRGARGKELDIATPDSRARILIIPTNEELMIAQDTYALAADASR